MRGLQRCDVRLMSSANGVGGIPTGGKNLIIVAIVDQVLHFRIFDDDGMVFVNVDEKLMKGQARQIKDLRKQLECLWPPHELTDNDKVRVIAAVQSIFGRTLLRKLIRFTAQIPSRTISEGPVQLSKKGLARPSSWERPNSLCYGTVRHRTRVCP